MKWYRLPVLVAVGFTVACGSTPKTLSMSPVTPAYSDESSVSPSLQAGDFARIMIVPPSGSAGVEFQENLAAIERSFIARGITVISSAITSRVILDDQTRDRQRAESGIELSEVERALLLAKESNADAVLQIGAWSWLGSDDSQWGRRYFVEQADADNFVEVDQVQYEQAPAQELLRYWYGSSVLAFTGRLIDVENGEVLASFKIDVPKVNVADPLVVSFDDEGTVVSQSYSWADDDRKNQAATNRAIGELFDRLAALISNAGM